MRKNLSGIGSAHGAVEYGGTFQVPLERDPDNVVKPGESNKIRNVVDFKKYQKNKEMSGRFIEDFLGEKYPFLEKTGGTNFDHIYNKLMELKGKMEEIELPSNLGSRGHDVDFYLRTLEEIEDKIDHNEDVEEEDLKIFTRDGHLRTAVKMAVDLAKAQAKFKSKDDLRKAI